MRLSVDDGPRKSYQAKSPVDVSAPSLRWNQTQHPRFNNLANNSRLSHTMGCCLSTEQTNLTPTPNQPRRPDYSGKITDPNLYVIVPISNPIGFKRRDALFREMIHRLCQTAQRYWSPRDGRPQVKLHIVAVELAFDQTPFISSTEALKLTPVDASFYHCLQHRLPRSNGVLWSKSNLVNLGMQHLHLQGLPESTVVAWLDADIEWTTDEWVVATLREMQATARVPFMVQMFETATFLDPTGRPLRDVTSFGAQHRRGTAYTSVANDKPGYWHPGFAWASTLGALNAVGGLMERTLGSEDRHMVMSIVGMCAKSIPSNAHQPYIDMVEYWTERVQAAHGNLNLLGCVKGGIRLKHHWHGDLINRRYVERFDILLQHQFDPLVHLHGVDSDEPSIEPGQAAEVDGLDRWPQTLSDIRLLRWSTQTPDAFKTAVLQYFQQRDEDSTVCLEKPQLVAKSAAASKAQSNSKTNSKPSGNNVSRGPSTQRSRPAASSAAYSMDFGSNYSSTDPNNGIFVPTDSHNHGHGHCHDRDDQHHHDHHHDGQHHEHHGQYNPDDDKAHFDGSWEHGDDQYDHNDGGYDDHGDYHDNSGGDGSWGGDGGAGYF